MRPFRTLVLVAALAACGGGGTTPSQVVPPGPPPPPPPPGGLPLSATVAMTSSDDGYGTAVFAFNPSVVSIARTGTITWSNTTGVLHNVTFAGANGAPADVNSFATGSASRTFNTAGTFAYQCTNHAGMTGQVIAQ